MIRFIARFFFMVLGCLLIMPPSSQAVEKMPPGLQDIVNAHRYQASHWGILVCDLKTGEPVYEFNADKLFTPASTTKLFTTATAFHFLGADYRFKTPIYQRGPLSKKGELKGDLILVASGDLTLGGRTDANGRIAFTSVDHTVAGDGPMAAVLTKQDPLAGLNTLAHQVAASGIRRVRGDVIIDDRLFEKSKPQADFERTPMVVNDNIIDFVITPTQPGKPAVVDWRPRTAFYHVEANVMTVAPKKPKVIEVLPGGGNRIIVKGYVAAGEKPSVRIYNVDDSSSFARTLLIEALQRAGVKVDAPRIGKNPSKRLPKRGAYVSMPRVALLESPPFSETARLILKVSHNLGADLLPLVVAANSGKRTFEDGLALERKFLEQAGVNVETISLSDGHGGSPANLLTPRVVVQLLRYMATRPDFKAYRDAQPILGVDGTLAHSVPPESPARGKVYAKTGTLIQPDLLNDRLVLLAKGLAGYMTAASGRELVFAIYAGGVPLKDLNDMVAIGNDLGKLTEIIYKEQ